MAERYLKLDKEKPEDEQVFEVTEGFTAIEQTTTTTIEQTEDIVANLGAKLARYKKRLAELRKL